MLFKQWVDSFEARENLTTIKLIRDKFIAYEGGLKWLLLKQYTPCFQIYISVLY